MKTRSLFLCTLASFFGYAVTQITAQAASPTIDLITSFTVPEPGADTAALGINSDGEIVGISNTPTDPEYQGFLRLRNGDFSVIVNPNGKFTVPTEINDSGLIAGYYGGRTSAGHSFFLSGETYTDFAIPGACSTRINGLNNAGDFAGIAYFRVDFDCNSPQAFMSVGGNVTLFTIPGAMNSEASGMNNLGQVVGDYYDGAWHGYLRDADGTLTFPIDYPGAAHTNLTGINDKGWMTGFYNHIEGDFHALFLQSPAAEFVSFDVGQSSVTAFGGINNRGFICGSYFDDSGVENGFLARVRHSSDEEMFQKKR